MFYETFIYIKKKVCVCMYFWVKNSETRMNLGFKIEEDIDRKQFTGECRGNEESENMCIL